MSRLGSMRAHQASPQHGRSRCSPRWCGYDGDREWDLTRGDRWALGRDFYGGLSYTYLKVVTPDGHHSKGGYRSPPLEPGMRLGTYTGHDDAGPDQIILRVTDDVSGVTVTLSDGRRDRLTLYSDPTHTGVGLAALVYPRDFRHPQDRPIGRFGKAASRSPVARLTRDSHSRARYPLCGGRTQVSEVLRLQVCSSSRSSRALCTTLAPPSLLKYA